MVEKMNNERFWELCKKHEPTQAHTEFFSLVNIVEKMNPHVIIEVGVENGGSLKFWELILKPGDLLIGIDWNDIEWIGIYIQAIETFILLREDHKTLI